MLKIISKQIKFILLIKIFINYVYVKIKLFTMNYTIIYEIILIRD